jgi:hypothetical protein
MRYVLVATSLSLALAASVTAKADMAGPIVNAQGQCRQYNGNDMHQTFSYWVDPPCVSTEERRGGVGRRLIRASANRAGLARAQANAHTRYHRRPAFEGLSQ